MAVNTSFGRLWPHCDARNHLVTVRAPVSGARFPVHSGIAPIVAEGLRRQERGIGGRAYLCKPAQCGAFNCRAIAGTNTPSNHSGGLAIDINWNDNPFRRGANYAMPEWVWRMWESLGFYWGGRYSDFMHIEWLKNPAAAAEMVRKITGGNAPKPILRVGDEGPYVREVQRKLAIAVDGIFGPGTEAAVKAFQRSKGLEVDGVVGPATWSALEKPAPPREPGVQGEIKHVYENTPGLKELLGAPVTPELATPDGKGRYNHFEKWGSIYWYPGIGARAVGGAIREKWKSLGWEKSPLGYPTSHEYAFEHYNRDGELVKFRQSNFEHGYIIWNPEMGAVAYH